VYDPRFVLGCFDTLAPPSKVQILYSLLDSLILANTLYLQSTPSTPLLYSANLVYQAEEIGHDDWRDIPSVLAHGGGDCEDLACYLVAERRYRYNERTCRPRVTSRIIDSPKYGSFTLYHITVLRADGAIEDPSAILGMPT
jgi:hypothetical protein